jgi:hypothetical protein
MGDEDIIDVADDDAGPRQTARNPRPGVHDVERTIYNQEIRRLRTPYCRERTASCPQREETGAILC